MSRHWSEGQYDTYNISKFQKNLTKAISHKVSAGFFFGWFSKEIKDLLVEIWKVKESLWWIQWTIYRLKKIRKNRKERKQIYILIIYSKT